MGSSHGSSATSPCPWATIAMHGTSAALAPSRPPSQRCCPTGANCYPPPLSFLSTFSTTVFCFLFSANTDPLSCPSVPPICTAHCTAQVRQPQLHGVPQNPEEARQDAAPHPLPPVLHLSLAQPALGAGAKGCRLLCLPAFVCFTRRSDGTHCGTACVALTCHPALPPDVNRSVDSLTLCLPACLPACRATTVS